MHSLWAASLQRRIQETGQPIWLGINAGASWRTLVVASLPSVLAATCPTHAVALQFICLGYLLVFVITVRLLERPVRVKETSPFLSNDA
jgi:hypothetical protein